MPAAARLDLKATKIRSRSHAGCLASVPRQNLPAGTRPVGDTELRAGGARELRERTHGGPGPVLGPLRARGGRDVHSESKMGEKPRRHVSLSTGASSGRLHSADASSPPRHRAEGHAESAKHLPRRAGRNPRRFTRMGLSLPWGLLRAGCAAHRLRDLEGPVGVLSATSSCSHGGRDCPTLRAVEVAGAVAWQDLRETAQRPEDRREVGRGATLTARARAMHPACLPGGAQSC